MKRFVSLLLTSALAIGLCASAQAETIEITSLRAKRVEETGSNASGFYTGEVNGTDCSGIVRFTLPEISGEITSAAFEAYLYKLASDFNGDLYAVRSSSSGGINASDYYSGANDTSVTRIENNFVTPSSTDDSTVSTSDSSLKDWINDQYDAGAEAGDYIFLRISADIADPDSKYKFHNHNDDYPPVLTIVTGGVDPIVGGAEDLIVDFVGSAALQTLIDNEAFWEAFDTNHCDEVVTGDMDGNGIDEIIVDFGTTGAKTGIQVWKNNAGWQQMHSLSPEQMVTGDLNGDGDEDVVMDFGVTYGIYTLIFEDWDGSSSQLEHGWSQLTTMNPVQMVTADMDGNELAEIIIDFGPGNGLDIWKNNSEWQPLHSLSADQIVAGDLNSDGDEDVVIDFGGTYGIYALIFTNWDGTSSQLENGWLQLTSTM